MPRSKFPEKTREQILFAALSAFAKKGYAETSMDDIAQNAGLTKGALYWHFESKLELYEAVVEIVFREQIDAVINPLANESSPRDAIEAVVKATIDFYQENELLMEFYSNMLVEGKMLAQANVKRILAEGYHRYRMELANKLEETGWPSGLQPQIVAAILISCLDGIFIQWSLEPEGVDLEKIGESIVILFAGV
jgi:TetR/AcrR family acrAB operon transcriptional repressor